MTPRIWIILCLAAAAACARVQAAPSSISLAGEWRFALDPGAVQQSLSVSLTAPLPQGDGIAQEWFKRDLRDRIRLPGILQAQGYGDEISPTTPWVLTLGDAWWKLQPTALRDHFSQPGHVEVPFLSQPPRHYLGVAWYQRDVDIPAGWQGRRVVLFLEHPHWESTVWWDDQPHAPDHSLSAPHIVDLGMIAPGRHRLTIRVDNRRIIVDPLNDGHAVDAHSVSDALGAAWNGIVGRIELRSTTPVWIEVAQAFPRVADRSVRIKVKIGNATGQAGSGSLSAGGRSQPIAWDAAGGSAEIEVPLGADAQVWSEFHPVLQHLTVTLKGGAAEDARPIVFGLREISHRDKDLLLNGQLINLRLTHFGGDFPLTGYPPTDVESWKKIIAVCQAYGLNGMRFHSWCPPDAAFTAADEMGFYLQPECGMWSPFNPGSVYTRLLEEETPRILEAYGNHPSFILLSPSNEPAGRYPQVTPAWAAAWYARDDRRLYSAGTGWGDRSQVEGGPQYASLVRYNSANLRNSGGWFGSDFRAALTTAHIPVLAHEVGQWCAYPDFDVIREFTGYLRPGNYDIFKYVAEQQGVLPLDHAFAYASGRFQVECYKEEIEANLRTPGLSGFQLLDLHDYLGQGAALIGLVDAFWKPKSYVTADEFRRFSGPTVPLARLTRRVFTTSESLAADVEIYHFADGPIRHGKPYWKVVDSRGRTAAEGRWPEREIAIGKNIPLGRVELDLSRLAAPQAYRLVVGLRGTAVANDWNFWVYPAQNESPTPAGVLVTHDWPEAAARLAEGGRVLFQPGAADLDPARCPPLKNVPVFWNIQMTVRPPRNPTARFDAMLGLLCDPAHPALAEFPTDVNCDWQWTPIINNVRSINLDGAPRTLRPIVSAIDDWNRDWRLGVIFECAVGPGRLLVSAVNLEDPNAGAGTRQLRRSLLDYMATGKFRPQVSLTPEEVGRLWAGGTPAAVPVKRAFDPDLDDSTGPSRPRGASQSGVSAAKAFADFPATAFKFRFGADEAVPGYTLVAPDAAYSKAAGYGFEAGSTVTAVKADSADGLQRGTITSATPFSFSVAVPEGNYRVTITLGDPKAEAMTTVKAEVRRLMVEHLHTDAGKFTTRAFTVNVRSPRISTGGDVDLDSHERNPATGEVISRSWDDKLTITLSDTHPALAALEIRKVPDAITVFVLGDSTVTDQPGGPGSSWGQMFTRWFTPEVAIANHAESGETLKGFLKERRWDKVLDSIVPGDYVIIEFGTNDSKKSGPQNIYPNQDFSETYADANTTYRELLRRFVADACQRGAHPIIVSPSARRGEVSNPSSLGRYAEAAGAVAAEVGVPFIDLNTMGHELNAALGTDAPRQFGDVTHHVEYGSYLQAKCVVLGIRQANLPLAKFIMDDFGSFDPNHPEPTPVAFLLPPDPRRAGGRRGTRPPVPGAN